MTYMVASEVTSGAIRGGDVTVYVRTYGYIKTSGVD